MSARFSPCRTWRYELRRQIGLGFNRLNRVVNFLMLNPSAADETVNDPTVRRCIGFAEAWGAETLIVTNLFAYRATDPRELEQQADPVGPGNDDAIYDAALESSCLIAAWGCHGDLFSRGAGVLLELRRRGVLPHALRLTKGGFPEHPLYLPSDLQPFPLRVTEPEKRYEEHAAKGVSN